MSDTTIINIVFATGALIFGAFCWLMYRIGVLNTGPEALYAGAVFTFILMVATLAGLGVPPS